LMPRRTLENALSGRHGFELTCADWMDDNSKPPRLEKRCAHCRLTIWIRRLLYIA